VDNVSGKLAGFQVEPRFAIRVYAQDFARAQVETTTQGLDGEPLRRPMSYAFERRSDEDTFRRSTVAGAVWTAGAPVHGVILPQWDPVSGRVELAIPLALVSS